MNKSSENFSLTRHGKFCFLGWVGDNHFPDSFQWSLQRNIGSCQCMRKLMWMKPKRDLRFSHVQHCNTRKASLHHFFNCNYSKTFWNNVQDWLNLKLNLPAFKISHIILYMDNLDTAYSDLVNIVIPLGKYHFHCSKWRGNKPSFTCFINESKLYYKSLKMVKDMNVAIKI